jgi:arylsulfatase A-like enzyme
VTAGEVGVQRPPSFNENPVPLNKPYYLRVAPMLSSQDINGSPNALDLHRLGMLNALQGLDRAVFSLTARLSSYGMLTNTVIIYISDNGYLYGEHRATQKYKVYQESVHVPFAIRYPAWTTSGYVVSHVVASVDMAPTISELAHLEHPLPLPMDGRSLVPYLHGPPPISMTPVHTYVVLEGVPEGLIPPVHPSYYAAHTGRYVYVENLCDARELYDVQVDPFQLTNLYTTTTSAPSYGVQSDLERVLSRIEQLKYPESPIGNGRCGAWMPLARREP